jgi:hypothetical protein
MLQRNGELPLVQTWTMDKGEFTQMPFRLHSTVQLVGFVLEMKGASNTGRIIGRAALYDAESALVAQSSLVNVSAGGRDLLFPLQPQPLTVVAGDYKVSFWFSPAMSMPNLHVVLTRSGGRYLKAGDAGLSFTASNGDFPPLLATYYVFFVSNSPAAPLVRLYGSTCDGGQPPALPAPLPAPLRLNDSVQGLLHRLRAKWSDVIAIGAAIIQTPDRHRTASSVSSPANARCPFLPLAIAASGIRRIDSLQPQNVTANDTFFPHAASGHLTALLVNMAVHAGRLSFNTTIKSVFPYLPWSSDFRPRQCECGPREGRGYFGQSPLSCNASIHGDWQFVTVAHLLTETAGLREISGRFAFNSWMEETFRMEELGQAENCTQYPLPSRRFFLQALLAGSIPNKPTSINTRSSLTPWLTDSLDPVVLGLILEEVYSTPWETLATALMADLGMTTGGFGVPEEGVPLQQREQQPHGHWRPNGTWISNDWTYPKLWRPSLGIHVSLMDWARLMACQLQQGRDLTAFGYPPPASGFPTPSSPPYLLTADEWKAASSPAVPLFPVGTVTGTSLLQLRHDEEPASTGRGTDSHWSEQETAAAVVPSSALLTPPLPLCCADAMPRCFYLLPLQVGHRVRVRVDDVSQAADVALGGRAGGRQQRGAVASAGRGLGGAHHPLPGLEAAAGRRGQSG